MPEIHSSIRGGLLSESSSLITKYFPFMSPRFSFPLVNLVCTYQQESYLEIKDQKYIIATSKILWPHCAYSINVYAKLTNDQ
jgi:hypothetical protein